MRYALINGRNIIYIDMAQIEACQLCLCNTKLLRGLNKEIECLIKTKILDYLSINIHYKNNTPIVICEDCLNNLNQFHIFAQTVYLAQRNFQKKSKLFKYETTNIEDNLPLSMQKQRNNMISQIEFNNPNAKTPNYINKDSAKVKSVDNELSIKTEFNLSDTEQYYESDDEDMLTESNQISFDNSTFPKELIKNCRLTITGKKLDNMLATFFGLKCNICINTTCFTTISNLIKHYEEVHNTKGYVLCCGQKITRQKAMAMHMASHIQPEAFTCTICNKILTCPKILQNHIQNHLPESQRPLCCPEPTCSRRFSYYSALTAHQASHLNEEEKITHICEECGKIFGTASALSTHINKTHKVNQKDKYKYVCHICAHRFSNSGNLGYHLGTHEHKMFNQVQCPECGKWSKNKQCLAKHMTQHTEAPLSCEFCTYKSKSKQALRLHTQTHHIEGKHYSCDVCNKTFKMKCTLNAHAAQHTGERKYKCNFCEKTFVNSGNFYAHRKRMHSTKLKEFYEERDRLENEERMKMLDNQNI